MVWWFWCPPLPTGSVMVLFSCFMFSSTCRESDNQFLFFFLHGSPPRGLYVLFPGSVVTTVSLSSNNTYLLTGTCKFWCIAQVSPGRWIDDRHPCRVWLARPGLVSMLLHPSASRVPPVAFLDRTVFLTSFFNTRSLCAFFPHPGSLFHLSTTLMPKFFLLTSVFACFLAMFQG
jgi:hypothetical protein